MADDIKVRLITPMFRMNNVRLDVATQYKEPGKAIRAGTPFKFGLGMIFDAEALTKFKRPNDSDSFDDVNISKVVQELAEQKWPEIKGDSEALKNLFRSAKGGSNWPIQKGETIIAKRAKKAQAQNKAAPEMPWLVGKYQINSSSSGDYPPVLTYKVAGKSTTLERENPEDMKKIKKLFVPGNYAIAEVTLVPSETEQGYFVNFYVNAVSFRKEGERIGGGGGGLMSRFEGIEGGETDFNPDEDSFEV